MMRCPFRVGSVTVGGLGQLPVGGKGVGRVGGHEETADRAQGDDAPQTGEERQQHGRVAGHVLGPRQVAQVHLRPAETAAASVRRAARRDGGERIAAQNTRPCYGT
jgi:hypothetical protein